MSSVPRWVCAYGNSQMIQEPTGNYIHINDVEELVRQAREDERLEQIGGGEAWNIGFEDGLESAILSAVQRVEALEPHAHASVGAISSPLLFTSAVIAAIKGE